VIIVQSTELLAPFFRQINNKDAEKSMQKSPAKVKACYLHFMLPFFAIICPASAQWKGLKGANQWQSGCWLGGKGPKAEAPRNQQQNIQTPGVTGATNGQRNQL